MLILKPCPSALLGREGSRVLPSQPRHALRALLGLRSPAQRLLQARLQQDAPEPACARLSGINART